VAVAGLVCLRPSAMGRLFYRVRVHRGRKGERRSLSEADYASLVTAAHNRLHAPIVLVWNNPNTHISAAMGEFIDAHRQWLTVVRLPAYAPELNPVEGVWSHMKRGLSNLTACGLDQLAARVKTRLKQVQYRPELIDGFLAQTGLAFQASSLAAEHHMQPGSRGQWPALLRRRGGQLIATYWQSAASSINAWNKPMGRRAAATS
jgi:transposase